jgi:3'-phosphoadenosine 5'-phosphosulfate sulfotransferase (PAPS reductase)/FAD synthetase
MKQATLDLLDSAPFKPNITADTVYHVGVSGGKDSAAALLWMVRESGIDPAKIRASFSDIGNDHEWTIEHVKLLSERVHPIETIKPEMDFFELALHKGRFPSPKARFCTDVLKIRPTMDHITKLMCSGLRIVNVSGVRADESEERKNAKEWDYSTALMCPQWRPLVKWALADVLAIHKRHKIPLNPLYSMGAERVGCWPCFMCKKKEMRTITIHFPERITELRKHEGVHAAGGRISTFFARDKVPERFRTKECTLADGSKMMLASIDDVARWSLTGKGAEGSWEDDPSEPEGCLSGFCE